MLPLPHFLLVTGMKRGVLFSEVQCACVRFRTLIMQVLRKPDGGSRGFGFVTFKDEMSVEKCLVMQHFLNGKQVRTSFVSVQHRITPELSSRLFMILLRSG